MTARVAETNEAVLRSLSHSLRLMAVGVLRPGLDSKRPKIEGEESTASAHRLARHDSTQGSISRQNGRWPVTAGLRRELSWSVAKFSQLSLAGQWPSGRCENPPPAGPPKVRGNSRGWFARATSHRNHFFDRGTFIERMLAPCVTQPLPPIMTRRTGRPVSGSVFKGGSVIFCWTSNRRGLSLGFFGIVS